MPRLEQEFTIARPIDEVWVYMSDMRNIGAGIPDCTVDVVDDVTSNWVIKTKVGPLTKKVKMTVRVIERDDAAHHVRFVGGGEMVDMSGTVDMGEAAEGTSIKLVLDLEGRGAIAGLLNSVISTHADSYTDYFVDSVTKALS